MDSRLCRAFLASCEMDVSCDWFIQKYGRGGNSELCFFLMIRRPPRSTLDRSSAASDVYKRQSQKSVKRFRILKKPLCSSAQRLFLNIPVGAALRGLSLIHISEPTRPY